MTVKSSQRQVKNKIKQGDRVVAVENIKYPYFECETSKGKTLCKKMNDFYGGIVNKYSRQIRQKTKRQILNSRDTAPAKFLMNYHISLENDRVISVVVDLSFSKGAITKSRRFSQMWSVDRCDILPMSDIIKTDRKSKKKIYSLVFSIAKSNSERSGFGYFSDWAKRIARFFDISNFFATEKGLCYFVDSGKLSPEKYGTSGFVLPESSIKECLKYDFLSED